MQDEQSLVHQAQHRDKEAFAQLYEKYFNRIYRYIFLRVGSQMEAEDLTQQVFLNALKSIRSFKWRGTPFSAWLYRIAHNLVVDYLRKSKKRDMAPLDEAIASSGSSPQQTVELKLDIERLAGAIKRLTQAQRDVISLRFSSELPIAEVAQVIGKSPGAVKALQHSAIVRLRQVLVE